MHIESECSIKLVTLIWTLDTTPSAYIHISCILGFTSECLTTTYSWTSRMLIHWYPSYMEEQIDKTIFASSSLFLFFLAIEYLNSSTNSRFIANKMLLLSNQKLYHMEQIRIISITFQHFRLTLKKKSNPHVQSTLSQPTRTWINFT